MSEQLVELRNRFLQAAVDFPIHPYPGPPKGWEDRPSCSYIGPGACMRKAYYNIIQRLGRTLPGVPTEETGESVIPAQMGWILEPSIRHWLKGAGLGPVEFEEPVFVSMGNRKLYYGHPDGWNPGLPGESWVPSPLVSDSFILEYKHQRVLSYVGFLLRGVAEESPLYYAQLQGYMAATGMKNALFIARPFDISGVKGTLTQRRRGKNYEGELEADFCMSYGTSGVNPAVYMEIVPSNAPYQAELRGWADTLIGFVEAETPPDRGFDFSTDWQCAYCSMNDTCLQHGRCKAQCGHKGCWA